MEVKEILELIQAVSNSDLTGFQYEENGVKISFKKEKKVISYAQPVMMKADAVCQNLVLPQQAVSGQTAEKQTPAIDMEDKTDTALAENLVTSPLVGTFYAAPAEDADPFVKVGDTVKQGQVLAIVEAMKLMNEIESEYDGTIAEILVENGQMVEYGQPLFRIA